MHQVTLINFGAPCKTRVWFSTAVTEEVGKFRKKGDPNGRFWKHLQRCAINGFEIYERGALPIVKLEWRGVYRVGFQHSLFRLIGFYEDGSSKASFIVIDAFLKRGQNLNASERARI